MTAYADYTFYHETYLGAVIPEPAFPRLALRASESLDKITFGRVASVMAGSDEDTQLLVKKCTCEMAETIYAIEQSGQDGLKSETQGSYGVTYSETSVKAKSKMERLKDIASVHLGATGLLFAGFGEDE